MPLTRAQKDDQIAHLSERFENGGGVYLADLSGMTVEKVTNFRLACRESDVSIRVFKNNVLKRAAKDTEFEPITPFLEGPTALLMCDDDAVAPARVLEKFIKANKMPKVKVACLEGTIYDDNGVKQLSMLPTRDELIAQLARALNGPLTNLVGVLSANPRSLARVLSEVSKQKGA
jgi:large subunit ribosomal protein L10